MRPFVATLWWVLGAGESLAVTAPPVGSGGDDVGAQKPPATASDAAPPAGDAGDPAGPSGADAVTGDSGADARGADAEGDAALAIIRAAEAERAREAALDDLAALVPPPPEAAAHWAYTVGGRAESVSGNADNYTLGVDLGASGRWGAWGTELKGSYAYGQNRLVTTPVANNASASARGERDLSAAWSTYLLVGSLFDRVASIKAQAFGEAGVGLTPLNRLEGARIRYRLRATAGFRTTYEARANYYVAPLGPTSPPDHWIYAPTVGINGRYSLSRSVYVTEEALVAFDVRSRKNIRGQSDTGLNVQLSEPLTLSLLFKVRYIGQPAPGRRPTDTSLAAALNYTF